MAGDVERQLIFSLADIYRQVAAAFWVVGVVSLIFGQFDSIRVENYQLVLILGLALILTFVAQRLVRDAKAEERT
jgi:hypothetical protein